MRSVRLTDSMRCVIRNAMIRQRFQAEEDRLEADKEALGKEVYRDIYPDDLRVLLARVPAGFLHHSDKLLVSFDGEMGEVQLGESLPVKKEHDRYRCAVKVYGPDSPITARFRELQKVEERIKSQKKEATAAAKAVLGSVYSIKRLIEVWPEAEPFAAPYNSTQGDVSAVRALTVPLSQLNALLGLPKKD